jgi:hypothetical protein
MLKLKKNNKAPCEDPITTKLIKHGDQILLRGIHKLMYMIWTQERMPAEWRKGLICPIFKKGDKLQCNTIEVCCLEM